MATLNQVRAKIILFIPKPSLKIKTVNKAGCFDIKASSLLAYLIYFLGIKRGFFFKIESGNLQHLFEKEFRETLQNFNSIRQQIEKMEIKIV